MRGVSAGAQVPSRPTRSHAWSFSKVWGECLLVFLCLNPARHSALGTGPQAEPSFSSGAPYMNDGFTPLFPRSWGPAGLHDPVLWIPSRIALNGRVGRGPCHTSDSILHRTPGKDDGRKDVLLCLELPGQTPRSCLSLPTCPTEEFEAHRMAIALALGSTNCDLPGVLKPAAAARPDLAVRKKSRSRRPTIKLKWEVDGRKWKYCQNSSPNSPR